MAGCLRESRQFGAAARLLHLAFPVMFENHFVGVRNQDAMQAVQDDRFAILDVLLDAMRADHGGHLHAARQDGGMRQRAAVFRREGADALMLEQHGFRRGQVVGQYDGIVQVPPSICSSLWPFASRMRSMRLMTWSTSSRRVRR